MSAPRALEVEVLPPCPYRLPRRGRGDWVMKLKQGVLTRPLRIDGHDVKVHAWQRRDGAVAFRAAADAPTELLEQAVARMRFALAVDDDLRPFYAEFKRDEFLGPAIRRRPWLRPVRRPFAWEALCWAITEQLIESSRAAQIQRRIVRRWGQGSVPSAAALARLAPAELAACDLSPARSVALVKCAREVAEGHADPANPKHDRRFLRFAEIGPWTLQCLGLFGRGEADTLPAGDLAYVKLVAIAAGLGRRAMVPEIEDFYLRYAPYRGLAGIFSLSHYAGAQSLARGLPMIPDHSAAAT